MINLSICLSDIPKEKITVSKSNGKKYLNITVAEMKEHDKYENSHTVYISQTKEQDGEAKIYIGKGREVVFNQKASDSQPTSQGVSLNEPTDDLPF